MIVLGLESSCDDTSVAIVDDKHHILAHQTYTQQKEHAIFGGVVPEAAARSHVLYMDGLITDALKEAQLDWADINAIAATAGPGLIGGVLVGVTTAKALCFALNKPFVGVNHLEAHVLSAHLAHIDLTFPYGVLLISGGHTQLLIAHDVGRYEVLGQTLDDAAGEAFDKVGKMMGIPYPYGPMLEIAARGGDPRAVPFSLPLASKKESLDFSFSGLKTAARRALEDDSHSYKNTDFAASFQDVIARFLAKRTGQLLGYMKKCGISNPAFVAVGGVAANKYINTQLEAACADQQAAYYDVPLSLCTDNGAMVAWTGLQYAARRQYTDLSFRPKPRWPLG
jgi:N6-L-threonylcarbamoyladenine synthase